MDETGGSGEVDALETEQKKRVGVLRHFGPLAVALLPIWLSAGILAIDSVHEFPRHWIVGGMIGSFPLGLFAYFLVEIKYRRALAYFLVLVWLIVMFFIPTEPSLKL